MTIEAHSPIGLPREWLPEPSRVREREILDGAAGRSLAWLDARVASLTERNREIHERQCINLNPATNVMNPRADAAMSAGLGSRPSLGYPGAKYEMGLEATEASRFWQPISLPGVRIRLRRDPRRIWLAG
jgi:hypothetical protein